MENKKIVVNYQKEWGNDGTTYTQTIKISFDIAFNFNKYVDHLKEKTEKEAEKTHNYTSEQLKILDYLLHINFYNKTFINLTTLEYFKKFYLQYVYTPPKKDKNYERILQRNTIIEVFTK